MKFRRSGGGLLLSDHEIERPRRLQPLMAAPQQMLMAGGGSSGTPFSAVSLLMHMEGGSFVDSSSYAHVVTASGATQDTGWAYFGTKSALIATTGGNQNRLTVPHHSTLDPGADEFTLEFALRLSSTGTTQVVLGKAAGTGVYPFQVIVTSADKLVFRGFDSGSALFSIESTTTLAANTDYWVQCRRFNGVVGGTTAAHMQLAIAGTQEATSPAYAIGTSMFSNTGVLYIGNFDSGAQFPLLGRIDELRISKGVARAFAVPGSAFPDS
jgi:hypothetical protein